MEKDPLAVKIEPEEELENDLQHEGTLEIEVEPVLPLILVHQAGQKFGSDPPFLGTKKISWNFPATCVSVGQKKVPATCVAVGHEDVPATCVAVGGEFPTYCDPKVLDLVLEWDLCVEKGKWVVSGFLPLAKIRAADLVRFTLIHQSESQSWSAASDVCVPSISSNFLDSPPHLDSESVIGHTGVWGSVGLPVPSRYPFLGYKKV
uniref:Uncharacterized protein n=1 Tax=Timema cristinae TaxID=61476 RepID=A0A7R9CVF6_TIMCR|nr:unnamed protein product [Timema cristinae]